jgi:predicted HicB family RNase H-like nuclease
MKRKRGENMKGLFIKLPPELHAKLKHAAIDAGTTLQALVIAMLKEATK